MTARYVRRETEAPSSAVGGSSSREAGDPRDPLGTGLDRLSSAALLFAAVSVVNQVLWRFAIPDRSYPPGASRAPMVAITALAVVGSVAMAALTRTRRLDPPLLRDLGLLYQVLAAFCIEAPLLWWDGGQIGTVVGLSWTCLWIVTYPLVVPTTPGKTLLAALAAASIRPGVLLVLAARGVPLPGPEVIAELVLPGYVSAGIALAASRMVYRLGRDVARARELGSYRLTDQLGVGGMGEVWRAEHRLLARPAAIKVISAELLGEANGRTQHNFRERFEREAHATASLSSPHTVELYDFGVADDGSLYYVMELLQGISLDDLVRRFGPIPCGRAAHIVRQVCDSLAEAHAVGLVHRDIKPANVFLSRQGLTCDFVKVLDFGLVKAPPTRDKGVRLTASGSAPGTPGFIAPEVLLEERVDGRADLYALGCVAYWMLTGTDVFPRMSAVEEAFAHVKEAPEPLSSRARRPIDTALERVVMQCLAKLPTDRPRTAEAVLERLAGDATPAWTAADAAGWWEAHLPDFKRAIRTAPVRA